nr:hypothetical protein [Tanacetum cinerariifolium]
FANFINPVDALQIQRQPYSEESQEQMKNRYCIETLLNVNPQHYKGARFTTEATILEITAPNGWEKVIGNWLEVGVFSKEQGSPVVDSLLPFFVSIHANREILKALFSSRIRLKWSVSLTFMLAWMTFPCSYWK